VQSGPSKGSTEPDLSLACAWSEVRAWGSGHDEFFVHTGSVLFLDGHNNPGFSRGPIVFRAFDQPGYVMRVAGVVAGYAPDLQFVLEPKKIMPGEDLHKVEPWRIVKIKGEKFKLEDTTQMVDTNSGIVRGYAMESAINPIKNRPRGPP
jgi:hypothetical protein